MIWEKMTKDSKESSEGFVRRSKVGSESCEGFMRIEPLVDRGVNVNLKNLWDSIQSVVKEGERGVWGIRGKPGVNGRRGDTEKRHPGGMRERKRSSVECGLIKWDLWFLTYLQKCHWTVLFENLKTGKKSFLNSVFKLSKIKNVTQTLLKKIFYQTHFLF